MIIVMKLPILVKVDKCLICLITGDPSFVMERIAYVSEPPIGPTHIAELVSTSAGHMIASLLFLDQLQASLALFVIIYLQYLRELLLPISAVQMILGLLQMLVQFLLCGESLLYISGTVKLCVCI